MDDPRPPRVSPEIQLAWGAAALFAVLSAFEAVRSNGFLEADSCTHYMYARFAFANPHFFTNVWGRPVCTGLYAVPALLGGRLGVRLASLGVALGLAGVAGASARAQHWRWPVLAGVFTLAQPLVFFHSFSELTELPFALLLALGFWAYQHRRWVGLAIAIGFTPLSRPEGFGLLLLAVAALVCHRRVVAILILPLPLLLWDWAGWHFSGEVGPWWHWLMANWPYASQSLYTPGPLLHFVLLLPTVVSPLLFPATLLGLALCLMPAKTRQFFRDHTTRCDVLIAIIPLSILIGHSLLYWRGKMASNGELRYMLTVASFWGLLSARGWGWVFERLRWPRPLQWAALTSVAPLLLNCVYRVLPLQSQPDWLQAQAVARWYQSSGLAKQYPFLAAAHPGIYFAMDKDPSDRTRFRDWQKSVIDPVPPGTLLVWDGCYGVSNADPNRSITQAELVRDGWTFLPSPFDEISVSRWPWRVFVSSPLLASPSTPVEKK